MQASHVLPEGAYPNLKFDPDNIIPQCYAHHIHWWHKSPMEAGLWFQKEYPKQWKYLLSMKRTHFDWTPDKINRLIISTGKGLEAYRQAYDELKPLP